MKATLSYVLVTPYAISKSRTGGILSRLLSRTSLDLVGAQMFAADRAFAEKYAQALRERSPKGRPATLADYVEREFAPGKDGRPRCAMLLLFRGDDPCARLSSVCGDVGDWRGETPGGTILDTYGDLVFSPENPDEIAHFEPAALTPRNQREADGDLRMMADFLDGAANAAGGLSPAAPPGVERTLVIIKPDNWTFHSARPGAIMDMFSCTGLDIADVKIHRFSLAQALDFYGPVEEMLRKKLSGVFGKRAAGILGREFGVSVSERTANAIAETFGAECAGNEFAGLVEFMCGKRPGACPKEDLEKPGDAKCMILVYEGANAVAKIRDALGPTNPADAPDGTVRREFGQSVMVNAAHASDSAESFLRERAIVKMGENTLAAIIRESLG